MPRPKQNNKNTGESEEQSERTGEEFYHLRMPEYKGEQKAAKISRASKQRFGLVLSCRLVAIKRFE